MTKLGATRLPRIQTTSERLGMFHLSLLPLWLFPLFFAYKAIELGRLGLCGRGLAVTSSKVRWKSLVGRTCAAALVLTGGAAFLLFACWLIAALITTLDA